MVVIRDIVYLYPAEWRAIAERGASVLADRIGIWPNGPWHPDVLLPLGGWSQSDQGIIGAAYSALVS